MAVVEGEPDGDDVTVDGDAEPPLLLLEQPTAVAAIVRTLMRALPSRMLRYLTTASLTKRREPKVAYRALLAVKQICDVEEGDRAMAVVASCTTEACAPTLWAA